MSDSQPSTHSAIRFLNSSQELELHKANYHSFPQFSSIVEQAYLANKEAFQSAVNRLELPIFDAESNLIDFASLTLTQIENISREMGLCGFGFLECGNQRNDHKFYQFIPSNSQPFLDELFEFGFYRELEKFQCQLTTVVDNSELSVEKLMSVDLSEREITIEVAESLAKQLHMPLFEILKNEYIFSLASQIRGYSSHRIFQRLKHLRKSDRRKILDYLQFMIQADGLVTAGELEFIDQSIERLDLENFDIEAYKQGFITPLVFEELRPLSNTLLEPIRRQILGIVINCAFSDKMLNKNESSRLLQLTHLILDHST